MPLATKTRLGTYEILGPLGAGGMGEVYRAKDLRLGREVAIKVLASDVAASPDRLARLEREARTVARLNHPNIVILHSIEEDDGVRFLTMELVEGQSLTTLIVPSGMPALRILELAIPLTDALAAAHERGIVHRDLKPGNVMLTRDGRVKVLDFGLAKLAEGASAAADAATIVMSDDSPLSTEGEVIGTVSYMAPEQVRGQAVDRRTDLFALGVVLYELAAGRRPFAGATPIDLASSILRDTPESLTRVRGDLPAELERIVGRCLAKDPAERYANAIELRAELHALRLALESGQLGSPRRAPARVASIAVLPFVNRSHDEEEEYFSEGLADELLTMLTKIRGLRVAARTSAFQFRGKSEDVTVIGKKLNVATLLEGTVRRAGGRVRISVELVRTSDGDLLWSESFDRLLDDIFKVQDEIARSVVRALRTTILAEEDVAQARGEVHAEVAHAAKGRAAHHESHRLYLLARHLIARRNSDDTMKGIEYLREAVALDPGFALAWLELGTAHSSAATVGWMPAKEGFDRALDSVRKSLELEPDLAEGHAELARILMFRDHDWEGAEASIRRALELAPGNDLALRVAGSLAYIQTRYEEAIRCYHRVHEQDPLRSGAHHDLGMVFHMAGRYAEAEAAYRSVLELAPQRTATRAFLSLTLAAEGRLDDALTEAKAEPYELFRLWAVAIVHHARGERGESRAALGDLIAKFADEAAYQIAEIYAHCGDADAAFEWLERAFAVGDPGIAEAKCSPLLRPLHRQERWPGVLAKLGFAA